jgi:hypothetical protein
MKAVKQFDFVGADGGGASVRIQEVSEVKDISQRVTPCLPTHDGVCISKAQLFYCMPCQLMADTFGLFMWPSAHLLSRFVWEQREHFRDRLVIELGAGTGLPGLLAAHRAVGAAHVYITDR